ncbi:MAG: hypothetical protein JW395_1071 [Nitrospira sp.]|nr:hypothetical protein [Nitrospira sp.]
MANLKFNRLHKNGWLSYKVPGVAGAVFIDKRTVTPEFLANPPAELNLDIDGLLPPGADASEAAAARAAKKAEREALKAEKATKAQATAAARLEKLQAAAAKAQAKADAVAKKAAGGDAPAVE